MIYIAQKPEAEQARFSIIPSEKTGSTAGCEGSVCQAEANAKLKRKPGSGRRALMQPTEDHVRIIELVRVHGVSKTALQIGRSRQRVHQVISRWAPELKKFKLNRMSEPVAKRVRLPRRNIVVSFRIGTVYGLGLLYYEPITTLREQDSDVMIRDDSFFLRFAPKLKSVEMDLARIPSLLFIVRRICDAPECPPGRGGCSDCCNLARLLEATQQLSD